MVGKIKTRGEEETEEIADNLHSQVSSFYTGDPFPDDDYVSGVEIAFHGDRKIIAIDDETMPENEEEYNFLVEEIEKITKVSWDSWGYNQDFDGRYYYVNIEE